MVDRAVSAAMTGTKVRKTVVSDAKTAISASETIVSVAETVVLDAETVVSETKWSFQRQCENDRFGHRMGMKVNVIAALRLQALVWIQGLPKISRHQQVVPQPFEKNNFDKKTRKKNKTKQFYFFRKRFPTKNK